MRFAGAYSQSTTRPSCTSCRRRPSNRRFGASGYNPDSALAPADLVALGKQVRSDYALAGAVERTPTGVRSNLRLLTQTGKEIVTEPLAPMVGSDFGDIAKQVDRAVSEAIRALLFYQECTNALRVGDYGKAIAFAQQGLQLRPTSAALKLRAVDTERDEGRGGFDNSGRVADHSGRLASTLACENFANAFQQKGDSVARAHRYERASPPRPEGQNYTWLIDRLINRVRLSPRSPCSIPRSVPRRTKRDLLRRRGGSTTGSAAPRPRS